MQTYIIRFWQLLETNLFTHRGRAGRLQFAVQNLTMVALGFALLWLVHRIFLGISPFADTNAVNAALTQYAGWQAFVFGLLCMVLMVAGLIVGAFMAIRRLHDLNLSGWWFAAIWAYAFIISMVQQNIQASAVVHLVLMLLSFLPSLLLLLVPGSQTDNRYGPPVIFNDEQPQQE